METSKFLKRQVTFGDIEADYDNTALVVHYEVEASALNDIGEATHSETKSYQKKIRLRDLNEHSNIPLLAQEIVERCDFIHDSKIPHVIELLFSLQNHMIEQASRADSAKTMEKVARQKRRNERKRRAEQAKREAKEKEAAAANASMDKLDDYLEKLYDESMEEKVAGTGLILQLSKTVGNLEALITNEALMGALSRVLKDDYRKSTDLTINIMHIFFNFSVFSEMHKSIINYRIGDMTMKVLDLEQRRYDVRMRESERLAGLAAAQASGDAAAESKYREEDEEEGKRAAAEASAKPPKGPKKGRKAMSKMKWKPLPDGAVNMDQHRRKLKSWMRKQEQLLYICFCILLNLAEDIAIEKKMCKRGIVEFLVPMLDRPNPKLLLLVVNFLRKLSIFEENMRSMATLNVVEKLSKFVPCNQEQLLRGVLRLLFNLSFEPKLRDVMLSNSLVPKLVSLLKLVPFRAITLRLLYHISMDDRAKSEFTYTDAIPLVMQLIIHFPEQLVAKELVALGINLSHNVRNAERMVADDGLKLLIARVLKTHDWLLMKIIRNLSHWTNSLQTDLPHDSDYTQEGLWSPYVRYLYRLARHADRAELLVEVLGTLANLTERDLPEKHTFASILTEFSMIEFLYKQLVPGFADDDIVLEVVMLIGQCAAEQDAALLFARSNMPKILNTTLAEKHTDGEIVLQTLFTMWRLLHHKDTAEALIYGTNAVDAMCDFLTSKNAEIARMSESCLDIVLDYDMANNPRHEIADKVKQVRFERYNAVWLKVVAAEEETQAETKAWAMGAEDSEGSASYEDDSGRWGGAMHMGHEAVAVDMDMLGYDATQWSDTGSPDGGVVGGAGAGAGAGGGAGGGAGAHDRHGGPAQWETSHPHEDSWDMSQ